MKRISAGFVMCAALLMATGYTSANSALEQLSGSDFVNMSAPAPIAAAVETAVQDPTDTAENAKTYGLPGASGLSIITKLIEPAVPVSSAGNTGQGPVIVAISGLNFGEIGWGPLEVKHFIKLADVLFPKKQHDPKAFNASFDKYNSQFDNLKTVAASPEVQQEEAAGLEEPLITKVSVTNYVADKVKRALPAGSNATIVRFNWSRDPEDTETVVAKFIPQLAKVYDDNPGRPIYILAHSWGTVIMHDVLHKLEAIRPDVKIDKFITIGSPLMPGNAIVNLFNKLEISKEDLTAAVSKPGNVRYWHNVWASRDLFSNIIAAADNNVQVDNGAGVEDAAYELKTSLFTANILQLKRDFVVLESVRKWHMSYLFGFKADLKSIGTKLKVTVYAPVVAPQIYTVPQQQ
ncbi:MAG: hypothetical protein NTX59_00685 [Elusimicrobia bacterium]|nr:hypothetical protein [Elusimicrobiota bacterium]